MGIYSKEIMKHIVTISPEGKDFYVDPYALQAKKSDIIYFQNVSRDEAISIFFPEKELFGISVIEKLLPRTSTFVTVQNDVEPDSYPYIVYIHDLDDFASKDAAPKIIIYDDLEKSIK